MAGGAASPALSAGSRWCDFFCFESIFIDRQIWRVFCLLSSDAEPSDGCSPEFSFSVLSSSSMDSRVLMKRALAHLSFIYISTGKRARISF